MRSPTTSRLPDIPLLALIPLWNPVSSSWLTSWQTLSTVLHHMLTWNHHQVQPKEAWLLLTSFFTAAQLLILAAVQLLVFSAAQLLFHCPVPQSQAYLAPQPTSSQFWHQASGVHANIFVISGLLTPHQTIFNFLELLCFIFVFLYFFYISKNMIPFHLR